MWDVLQLLIVPTALAIGAFYLQETSKQRDLETAQANREKDQQIADDRAKQEILNRYFDQISTLLFERQLRTAKQGDEVRIVARVRTLAALRELDGPRKGLLLRFLQEADLIQKDRTIVSLTRADFYKADLRWVNLRSANLSKADFNSTDFHKAYLAEAQLAGTILWNADLSEANLTGANLREARLEGAKLNGAKLDSNSLKTVFLCNTTMPDGTKSDRDCDKLKQRNQK